MAEIPTEQNTYGAPPAIQNLRALAQSHLSNIETEDSEIAEQQEMAARDLQKYAKVKRKDRSKASTSPLPPPAEIKGAKLRSASDVLDRLRHDSKFNIDEYRVGYLERFEGIKEMLVTSWISESTDEEWIPQHRIRYIKRVSADGTSEIVWDRETKVDKIFGSGKSVGGDDDQSEFGGVTI